MAPRNNDRPRLTGSIDWVAFEPLWLAYAESKGFADSYSAPPSTHERRQQRAAPAPAGNVPASPETVVEATPLRGGQPQAVDRDSGITAGDTSVNDAPSRVQEEVSSEVQRSGLRQPKYSSGSDTESGSEDERPRSSASHARRREGKAKYELMTAVDETIRPQIQNCVSAYEMWTTLKTTYSVLTPDARAMLHSQWTKLAADPKDTIATIFAKVLNLQHQLTAAGIPQSEEQVRLKILDMLPSRMRTARDVLSMERVPRSLDEMKHMLLTAEINLLRQSVQPKPAPPRRDPTAAAALAAAAAAATAARCDGGSKRGGRGGKRGGGSGRRDAGNKAADQDLIYCRKNGLCFKCKKPGHQHTQCPTMLETLRANLAAAEALAADTGDAFGMMATAYMSTAGGKRASGLADKWTWDGAASHHMTCNKADFISLVPLSPVGTVHVGGGTLPVEGRGTVHVDVWHRGVPVRITLDALYVPGLGVRLFSAPTAAQAKCFSLVADDRVTVFKADGGVFFECALDPEVNLYMCPFTAPGAELPLGARALMAKLEGGTPCVLAEGTTMVCKIVTPPPGFAPGATDTTCTPASPTAVLTAGEWTPPPTPPRTPPEDDYADMPELGEADSSESEEESSDGEHSRAQEETERRRRQQAVRTPMGTPMRQPVPVGPVVSPAQVPAPPNGASQLPEAAPTTSAVPATPATEPAVQHPWSPFKNAAKASYEIWHQRYGHIGKDGLLQLARSAMVNGLELTGSPPSAPAVCEGCAIGKAKQHPFPTQGRKRADTVLGIVHVDVGGPYTVSVDGKFFVMVAVDDKTGMVFVWILRYRSEAPALLEAFAIKMERQHGHKVRIYRTDGAGEFKSRAFQRFCIGQGIVHQMAVAYEHGQNGVAERHVYTVVDKARAMMASVPGFPRNHWPEAIRTAALLINMSPHKAVPGMTPWQAFYNQVPDVSYLRAYGCLAYPAVAKEMRGNKLAPRAQRGILIGYEENTKGYRILLVNANGGFGKVVVRRSVQFNEAVTLLKGTPTALNPVVTTIPAAPASGPASACDPLVENQPTSTTPYDQEESDTEHVTSVAIPATGTTSDGSADSGSESDDGMPVQVSAGMLKRTRVDSPPAKSARPIAKRVHFNHSNVPSHHQPRVTRSGHVFSTQPHLGNGQGTRNEVKVLAMAAAASALLHGNTIQPPLLVSEVLIPNSFKGAMVSDYATMWKQACDAEVEKLQRHGTYSLVPLPEGRRPIRNRWVFDVKQNANNEVTKFRARLVAKGFSQRPGVDFTDTFAPTASPTTTRYLIATAATLGRHLSQYDVDSAFLNAPLSEEIYMAQPEGYVVPGQEQLVCKLHKAIYGLRQAARAWGDTFTAGLAKLGFVQATADPCLYIRGKGKSQELLVIHIDDMVASTASLQAATKLAKELASIFSIKQVPVADCFLGVQIDICKELGTIKIHQSAYAARVLDKYGMADCKPVDTPMTLDKLSKAQCPATPEEISDMASLVAVYQGIVGSVMYLAAWTRPDIAHAVGVLARFNQNPGQIHLAAAKRLLRYIKGTVSNGITYQRVTAPGHVIGYVDADWAGNPDNRRSTSGYVFLASNGAISWSSKLQTVVADSTAEAEYVSAARATKEALWLRKLQRDFGISTKEPMVLYEDNMACMQIAKDPVDFSRTKHIDIKYHLVRLHVKLGDVALIYVPTNQQAADALTKALPRAAIENCKQLIGMDIK